MIQVWRGRTVAQKSIGMSSRSIRSILAGAALLGLLAWPWAASAVEYVDLELVIATDVSYSIDEDEARLQREGVAAAFRSKEVIRAIGSGFLRKIAVAYIDYSSSIHNRVVLDWRILSDRESAQAFAASLLKAFPTFGRRTVASGHHPSDKIVLAFRCEG